MHLTIDIVFIHGPFGPAFAVATRKLL